MKRNLESITKKVLLIIDYTADKEKFIERFLKTCYLQALADLIKKLPEDKQKILKKQLAENKEANKIEEIIKDYFGDEEYAQTIKKASATLFQEWILAILPTLSEPQKISFRNS